MDKYSTKINKIKFTIDEIKNDIEKMKKVNIILNNIIIKFILNRTTKKLLIQWF